MGSDPGSLPDVDQKVCGSISGFGRRKKKEKNKKKTPADNEFLKDISLYCLNMGYNFSEFPLKFTSMCLNNREQENCGNENNCC